MHSLTCIYTHTQNIRYLLTNRIISFCSWSCDVLGIVVTPYHVGKRGEVMQDSLVYMYSIVAEQPKKLEVVRRSPLTTWGDLLEFIANNYGNLSQIYSNSIYLSTCIVIMYIYIALTLDGDIRDDIKIMIMRCWKNFDQLQPIFC